MAALIKATLKGYHYFNIEVSDPRTHDWLFMSSPWSVVALVGAYLYFVHVLGPRLMEYRQPFKLERIMQIYNVTQIILSGILLYRALTLAWLRDYHFACEPVDYSETPRAIQIAGTVYLYFIVKIIDLLDTVFFVLRKKSNQISFLHVYHHGGMVVGTWVAVKYFPGGHVTFLGLVNSFVHIVMYGYYLAASMKISQTWWKKYITQLQLFQFFLILIQFVQLIWKTDCAFPRWTAALFIPQNLFMIFMFSDFYYQTYVKPTKAKSERNGKSTETNGRIKSD